MVLSVASLTDDQRVRLETAIDGRDHQEEAFVALLENVRSWRPDAIPGDTPLILQPDFEAMLADPEQWRGTLCRIEGIIQQQHELERPYERTVEWFVRTDAGRPVQVFIAESDDVDIQRFGDGRRVVVYARFYKRIDAVARDGATHAYPVFVGRKPSLARGVTPAGGYGLLVTIAVPIAGLLVVFVLVWAWSRRRSARPPGRHATRAGAMIEVDDGGPLPDDPCEALGELKRRAEDRD
jgi:hypothetical protein